MKKECMPSDTINGWDGFSHCVYCLYRLESYRTFELEGTWGYAPLSYSASCHYICPVCLPCLSSPITSLSKAGPIYFASQYFFLFLVGAHKRLLKECTNYGIVENGQALEWGTSGFKSPLHQELRDVGKAKKWVNNNIYITELLEELKQVMNTICEHKSWPTGDDEYLSVLYLPHVLGKDTISKMGSHELTNIYWAHRYKAK